MYSTEQVMRVISIFDAIVWMVYDYAVGAHLASVGDICTVEFIFIAYIKYSMLKRST